MHRIGLFQKYHNTLCCPSKVLHKHCFHFLLGLTIAPREIGNNAYAKFGVTTKSIMVFLKRLITLRTVTTVETLYITFCINVTIHFFSYRSYYSYLF